MAIGEFSQDGETKQAISPSTSLTGKEPVFLIHLATSDRSVLAPFAGYAVEKVAGTWFIDEIQQTGAHRISLVSSQEVVLERIMDFLKGYGQPAHPLRSLSHLRRVA